MRGGTIEKPSHVVILIIKPFHTCAFRGSQRLGLHVIISFAWPIPHHSINQDIYTPPNFHQLHGHQSSRYWYWTEIVRKSIWIIYPWCSSLLWHEMFVLLAYDSSSTFEGWMVAVSFSCHRLQVCSRHSGTSLVLTEVLASPLWADVKPLECAP